MNRYLIGVMHYFSGEYFFEVEAKDRVEALHVAENVVNTDPKYDVGGNFRKNSVRVLKKIPNRGKDNAL